MGKYFNYIICLTLWVCFFLSCNTTVKKSDADRTTVNTKEIVKDSTGVNEKWMQAINTKDVETLKKLYTNTVYGLSPKGIEFSSRDTLINIINKNNFVVKEVKTLKRIKASNTFDYELGSFKNKNDSLIKYIVIWDTSKDEDQRVLEFLAETDTIQLDLKEIDAQRREWIKLCNAHSAENLINTVYTANTMYYNHRPMVVGRANLIPIYGYMNNLNYQLTLSPIVVEPVSKNIVYEIGQCKGSYNGKYILIWQKTDEGWQVLFDANI